MTEAKSKGKPYVIPKRLVWDAYQRIKANDGAAGVDGVTVEAFERNLKRNLYKVWNRMSSGSYFPPAVRLVEIPKASGGKRPLGIPTVSDRIAQTVVKMVLEPLLEPVFHPDSFGYRPGRSALDAVALTRKRCWKKAWVIDLDIKGFFDNLDHELVERAVAFHTEASWVRLYVGRWLRAPLQHSAGQQTARTRGTPQGGVISPLLANLYLHYAFDAWLSRAYPGVQFERYADDIVVHCATKGEAEVVLKSIRERMRSCGLELHPTKTKIVYCQQEGRSDQHDHVAFDFLGYTFQPRFAVRPSGSYFVGFLPAISRKAAVAIRQTIRGWHLASARNNQSLEQLAEVLNPAVRGWLAYYGRFYRSKCVGVLRHLNRALVRWVQRKYKGFRGRPRAATHWLGRLARREPDLLVHWQRGIRPSAGG